MACGYALARCLQAAVHDFRCTLVLYGYDSPHTFDLLRAIQCGNPEQEILPHAQPGRMHCIEQWCKRTAVTVDDGRISAREGGLSFLNPANRPRHLGAAVFDV